MNRLQKALGIGALVLTLASGCSKPIDSKPIDSGQIVEKRYEPQREYVKRVFIPIGKMISSYRRTMIDDEDFIIIFGKSEGDQFRNRTVYVTKEVYDSLKEGDTFDTSRFSYEDSDPDYRK